MGLSGLLENIQQPHAGQLIGIAAQRQLQRGPGQILPAVHPVHRLGGIEQGRIQGGGKVAVELLRGLVPDLVRGERLPSARGTSPSLI